VALDGHGADDGPEPLIEGARLAVAGGIPVKLFGPPGIEVPEGVELVPCERWIANEDDPVASVRSTPDASVVRAAGAVAAGEASAVVSTGSTGAIMTAALFALKRLHGVHRPALAAQVPVPSGEERRVLFLDVGANTEVRPQHLVQFAFMGSAFSRAVLGVGAPRVALLSVGEEQKKGNPDVVEAHETLASSTGIQFVGNVEGRDLLGGAADVVVTDGFTGNITLKTLEGTARAVADGVRSAARSGPLAAAGGLLLRPALGGLRRKLDPNKTGGAILLGLRGVAVVAHGSSTGEGVANAIRLADRATRERAVERTAELLEASSAGREALRTRGD
jgi:glycerol-3-phosphate acyltransferase PlsX